MKHILRTLSLFVLIKSAYGPIDRDNFFTSLNNGEWTTEHSKFIKREYFNKNNAFQLFRDGIFATNLSDNNNSDCERNCVETYIYYSKGAEKSDKNEHEDFYLKRIITTMVANHEESNLFMRKYKIFAGKEFMSLESYNGDTTSWDDKVRSRWSSSKEFFHSCHEYYLQDRIITLNERVNNLAKNVQNILDVLPNQNGQQQSPEISEMRQQINELTQDAQEAQQPSQTVQQPSPISANSENSPLLRSSVYNEKGSSCLCCCFSNNKVNVSSPSNPSSPTDENYDDFCKKCCIQ